MKVLHAITWIGLWIVSTSFAAASPITIGFISFDRNSPIDGQNQASVFNFTGPTYGCSAADLIPACDDLVFKNVSLTVDYFDSFGTSHQTVLAAPDPIGPGVGLPATFIFPSTENVVTLFFAATLSSDSFHLTDGSIFKASTVVLSDPLIPGVNELSLLSVDTASVPEPSLFLLLCFLLVVCSIKPCVTAARRKA